MSLISKLTNQLDNGTLDKILTDYFNLLKSIENILNKQKSLLPDINICTKGCCSCCNGFFEISILDAMLIYSAIKKIDQTSYITEIASSFSDFAKQKGWNFPHFYKDIEEIEDQVDLSEHDNVPCPLLDDNGLCKIYRFRPSICRFQGFRLKDSETGFIMNDECSLMDDNREAIEFDIYTFDKTELDIFAKLCDVIPELEQVELSGWDTIISSVLLWKRK